MTVTPPPAVFAASRRVPDSAPHGRSEVAAHRCIPRRPSRKGNAAAWPGRPAPKDPDAICDKNMEPDSFAEYGGSGVYMDEVTAANTAVFYAQTNPQQPLNVHILKL